MSSCPSSFCTLRKSTRRFNRWVAKEWRRTCGETRAGEMPALTARFFKFLKKLSRVTCPETAVLDGNSHGDLRPSRYRSRRTAYSSTAASAAGAAGTSLSLAPLPKTRTCLFSKLTQFTGSATSSDTRRPQAYISASIAFSRQWAKSVSSSAASSSRFISPALKNFGSGFSCRGDKTPAAGFVLISSSE